MLSKPTVRLRTILLCVNLTVLILPLGGIVFLQIYENEIVRQKEAALIAQGAYVATVFREAVLKETGVVDGDTIDPQALGEYGLPVPPQRTQQWGSLPIGLLVPKIELMHEPIRDPLPRLLRGQAPADSVATQAGRAISPILFRAQTMTLDTVRVVDIYANVVSSTQGEEGLAVSTWQEVQQALQGEPVSFVRRRRPPTGLRSPLDVLGLRPDILVSVSLPVIEGGRILGAVVLTGVPSQVSEVLYGNRGTLLVAFGFLIFMTVLLALVTSLTITEPLQRLVANTKAIAGGQFDGVTSMARPMTKEIRDLSQSLDEMANTIRVRTDYIIAFARSVTHEFKTPLTAIRGTVELLQDHGDQMQPEQRARFLHNLDADSERLDRLIGRLLELARADAVLPGEGEGADWRPVLRKLADHYRQEGVAFTVEDALRAGDDRSGRVPMGATDLETAVVNLIENAKQHGGKGVNIVLAAEAKDAFLKISVKDDGPGISSANQEQIFKPFFTTSRKEGGTGLGLSIVKSLVTAHGGDVGLRSRPGETVITLTLPFSQ